jgi:RnfABCDGE-type electron transport complex G subunit
MKDLLKLPVILTLVTVVAAGALAYVFNTTKPKIEAEKKLVQERALKESLPKAARGVIVPVKKGEKILYYKGFASPDTTNLVGYIILSSAHGYSSTIEVMVGVDTAGVIQGMKILSQAETPGLGAKVTEVKYGDKWPWFQHQFIGKKIFDDNGSFTSIRVVKGGVKILPEAQRIHGVDAISGGTITSNGVNDMLKNVLESYVPYIEKQKYDE